MSRNRSSTACECGTSAPATVAAKDALSEAAYFRAIEWENCPYIGNLGHGWHLPRRGRCDVHFARWECPACGRQYALWCAEYLGAWVVGDSSFWGAFNDEPGSTDGPRADWVPPPRPAPRLTDADLDAIAQRASDADVDGVALRDVLALIAEVRAAEKRVEAWAKLSDLQDKLLACHRLQRNPGAILDLIAKAREAVEGVSEVDHD